MIADDQELQVTLDRIARFQAQVAHLRKVETNPANYHAAVTGFLAEMDRMQLEVREYLSLHPAELKRTVLDRGCAAGTSAQEDATEGWPALAERLGPGRPVLFRQLTPPPLSAEGLGWVVLRVS